MSTNYLMQFPIFLSIQTIADWAVCVCKHGVKWEGLAAQWAWLLIQCGGDQEKKFPSRQLSYTARQF